MGEGFASLHHDSLRTILIYHERRPEVRGRRVAIAERVGFVGLGIMGRPMARNLVDAGFELTVYNRTASKADALAELRSIEVAYSLGELASQSTVVITMLPGPPEVEAVVAGEVAP
jgi:lactate dehydrogenase-like 2-hydroxyacid dehydrogenase